MILLLERKGGGLQTFRKAVVLITLLLLTGIGLPPRETAALQCYYKLLDTQPLGTADCGPGKACVKILKATYGIDSVTLDCVAGQGLECMKKELGEGLKPGCAATAGEDDYVNAFLKCGMLFPHGSTRTGQQGANQYTTHTYCLCDTDLCNDPNVFGNDAVVTRNKITCRVTDDKTGKSREENCPPGVTSCDSVIFTAPDKKYHWAWHACGDENGEILTCLQNKYTGGSGECTGTFLHSDFQTFKTDYDQCKQTKGSGHASSSQEQLSALDKYNGKMCVCKTDLCNAQFGEDRDMDKIDPKDSQSQSTDDSRRKNNNSWTQKYNRVLIGVLTLAMAAWNRI